MNALIDWKTVKLPIKFLHELSGALRSHAKRIIKERKDEADARFLAGRLLTLDDDEMPHWLIENNKSYQGTIRQLATALLKKG